MRLDPWLPRAAALHPGRAALALPGERVTYAELLAGARAVAGALAARGTAEGDVVALDLPPGRGLVTALHGCALLGAVAMPVDTRLTGRERAARLQTAAAVLDGPPHPDAGAARAPVFRPRAGDPLLVVHTSGTTGEPRPVTLSHGNVLANALGSAVALGLDPAERWLCPLPLSHVGGLMVLLRSVVYGTTAVLEPPPFDAGRVAGLLGSGAVTVASLVPTMLARVLDAGVEPAPALRRVLLGGAPAAPALLARARDAGVPVSATYGLTQACSQVTVAEPGDLETSGHPLPGVDVELAADGEIVVGGPTVAGGGPLATGDLGRLDDRGRLVVIGRKSDTIVTGGENVAPAEVEAVLLEHPAVADAGVVGRPDPEWGEAVTAIVVARDGRLDPGELRAFCAARLARFKVPKTIELAPELPRTASGKLRRGALGG
jgi:O-succinylbenzoic acid--CoA ligase